MDPAWCQCYKTLFSLLPTLQTNKLDRLSLAMLNNVFCGLQVMLKPTRVAQLWFQGPYSQHLIFLITYDSVAIHWTGKGYKGKTL